MNADRGCADSGFDCDGPGVAVASTGVETGPPALPPRHAGANRLPRLLPGQQRRGWRATCRAREACALHDARGDRARVPNATPIGIADDVIPGPQAKQNDRKSNEYPCSSAFICVHLCLNRSLSARRSAAGRARPFRQPSRKQNSNANPPCQASTPGQIRIIPSNPTLTRPGKHARGSAQALPFVRSQSSSSASALKYLPKNELRRPIQSCTQPH